MFPLFLLILRLAFSALKAHTSQSALLKALKRINRTEKKSIEEIQNKTAGLQYKKCLPLELKETFSLRN